MYGCHLRMVQKPLSLLKYEVMSALATGGFDHNGRLLLLRVR